MAYLVAALLIAMEKIPGEEGANALVWIAYGGGGWNVTEHLIKTKWGNGEE